MEQIKIKCKGAGELSINLLTPLQGDLKTLSDENYSRLKQEIITDGFSFPIAVYENPDDSKIYVLDGHQRLETLHRMKDEGFIIPQIPINFVDAENLNHAKKKLLAAASQYGQYDQQGAQDFISQIHGIDNSFLQNHFVMPTIDFSSIQFVGLVRTVDVEGHQREITNKELSADEFNNFDHKCPKCGFEWNK